MGTSQSTVLNAPQEFVGKKLVRVLNTPFANVYLQYDAESSAMYLTTEPEQATRFTLQQILNKPDLHPRTQRCVVGKYALIVEDNPVQKFIDHTFHLGDELEQTLRSSTRPLPFVITASQIPCTVINRETGQLVSHQSRGFTYCPSHSISIKIVGAPQPLGLVLTAARTASQTAGSDDSLLLFIAVVVILTIIYRFRRAH